MHMHAEWKATRWKKQTSRRRQHMPRKVRWQHGHDHGDKHKCTQWRAGNSQRCSGFFGKDRNAERSRLRTMLPGDGKLQTSSGGWVSAGDFQPTPHIKMLPEFPCSVPDWGQATYTPQSVMCGCVCGKGRIESFAQKGHTMSRVPEMHIPCQKRMSPGGAHLTDQPRDPGFHRFFSQNGRLTIPSPYVVTHHQSEKAPDSSC